MAYAVTPDDVAARWRPLSADEEAVAAVLLEDAGLLLDTKMPALAADVAAGLVSERLVAIVLADAVQRVLRNPDVQTSVQVSSDGSVGQSFPTTVAMARPRLELTEADLAQLTPAPTQVASGAGGVYSVPLY